MDNAKPGSVFDYVTGKIIADLTRGVLPWQKPWGAGARGCPMRPCRHNGEPYNGVNVLLLWAEAQAKDYQQPTWMTYKQAALLGAQVRHGEKSTTIVYANKVTKMEADSTTGQEIERQIPFMRGYSVFNVAQIAGLPEQFLLPPPLPSAQPGRLENAGYFMRNTGAVVRHGGDAAFYSEPHDYIQLPHSTSFKDAESYYATRAHELTHWTKHETRLKRDFGRVVWGDTGYAKEELVAEIGAAFLCADLGITPETRPDHAAYIEHWLKLLQGDKKLIFGAAAHATRAVNYLQRLQPKPEPQIDLAAVIQSCTQTLYISTPLIIGHAAWRLCIERHGAGVRTRYEFLAADSSEWRPSQMWPRDDLNANPSGLPRGLVKLYRREQQALQAHGLVTAPASDQMALAL